MCGRFGHTGELIYDEEDGRFCHKCLEEMIHDFKKIFNITLDGIAFKLSHLDKILSMITYSTDTKQYVIGVDK